MTGEINSHKEIIAAKGLTASVEADGHTGMCPRRRANQVLLLSDQPLLVVLTDEGEVVLVAANPKEHRELGRFKAWKEKRGTTR